ncbi:hypothetical protein Dda_7435 [Drechslerella dactyloides]|uniref:DNA damage-responsive protein 48 n=1 Tax=Drechslerella dactyloides TaxID=74499 RepID=A0AAD6NIB2_DREDA|nr:hypothetical protein Dda_7435 [Drechslerella dactyloides]
MDFLKNLGGGDNANKQGAENPAPNKEGESSGGLGGFMNQAKNFANESAGGGQKGEKNEDMLDKAVDMVQEKVFKQGPQDNESALEQAKDEQISDFIRDSYKKSTGKDFPIADK